MPITFAHVPKLRVQLCISSELCVPINISMQQPSNIPNNLEKDRTTVTTSSDEMVDPDYLELVINRYQCVSNDPRGNRYVRQGVQIRI